MAELAITYRGSRRDLQYCRGLYRRNQQKGNTFAFRHTRVRCTHGGQSGDSVYDLTFVPRRVKMDNSRRICGF